jgi:DNA repair exonuclease SbcCD nuclease subunit
MSKLLACGDIHLGQGGDLGRQPGDRLQDQADVLERIAALAVDKAVDGVLVAGDVFEGPALPPEQLDIFAGFVARLRAARIPVLAITGNGKHDAAVRATNGLAIFAHIPGIDVSSAPDVFEFAGCAVATLPWVSPARLVAARGGGDRDELHADVAQMLVEIAQRGKEDCEKVAPGAPHILLGHWSVSGASLPTGLPVDLLREPVIPSAELAGVGFDAVVMGHIHVAQDLRDGIFSERQTQPPFFYVGSPLPLNFGEQTDPYAHGVYIVHTDERESIDAYAAEFIPIASRPLFTFDLADIEQWTHDAEGERLELAVEEGAIVRVRYTATSDQQRRLDVSQMRRTFLEAGAHIVRIQPEIVRQDRARVAGVDDSVTELDALRAYIDANHIEPVLAERMLERAALYLEAVA